MTHDDNEDEDVNEEEEKEDMEEYSRALKLPRIKRICEGLQALAKYSTTNDVDTCAEHDEFYAMPARSEIEISNTEPPELAAEMRRLGWHWSDGDSWAIFT